MWCNAKDVHLSLSTMHGGSESQSKHKITTSTWLFNSLWRHFWISVVLLSQTSVHTHSTEGKTPPGKVLTDQENQVHSVEWAESLVWAQARVSINWSASVKLLVCPFKCVTHSIFKNLHTDGLQLHVFTLLFHHNGSWKIVHLKCQSNYITHTFVEKVRDDANIAAL